MFEQVQTIAYTMLLIALAYRTFDIYIFSFSIFGEKPKDNLK